MPVRADGRLSVSGTVVVVAHPDDEVLWAGGYLLAHPGTDVICCTVPQKAPERCLAFFWACKALDVNPIIVAEGRDVVNVPIRSLRAVQRMVEQYDQIITHNHIGEYGHPHHIQVHKAMRATGIPMKVFGYGLTADGMPVSLQLNKNLLRLYTTQPNCFKDWSTKFDLSREAFLDVDNSG